MLIFVQRTCDTFPHLSSALGLAAFNITGESDNSMPLKHASFAVTCATLQARLGGLIVKKRRSGALKFSTTSTEQRSAGMSMQGTGGGRRSNAGGSTPSARGARQTSLLDFCSGTSSTAPGVLPGQALPPTPSTSAATPLRHLEDQMSEGEEESGVEDMEIAEGDDYESVAPPRTTVPTGVVGSPSTAASPSTPARPATPGRAPPPSPSNSFGLLGGGAVATLAEQGVGGPSPAKAGGGGGGEMGAGGGHHRPAVYSDRFIPARSGSIMESGSPFLAGSPSPPKFAGKGSPSGRRRGAAGVGVRGGGDRRIIGTDRHEIADPGGVRGTEIVAGQGGTGAAGGGGAGGGGTAAAAAGSPEYWPYGSSATDAQREGQTMLNMLLRSELLGADMSTSASARPEQQPGGGVTTEAGRRVTGAGAATSAGTLDATGGTAGALTPSPNVFRFKVGVRWKDGGGVETHPWCWFSRRGQGDDLPGVFGPLEHLQTSSSSKASNAAEYFGGEGAVTQGIHDARFFGREEFCLLRG